MARKTLKEAEHYPGELEALRDVMQSVDEAAQAGAVDAVLRVLQEHHEAEDAAVSALTWVPTVGEVYALHDGSGVERYRARVIAEGLWLKKMSNPYPGAVRSFGGHQVTIRRTDREDEGSHPAPIGVKHIGRLVLMTSGGAVMGHDREIKALETLELPEIPTDTRAADLALMSIQEAGKTAGLILNVRETKDLVPVAGERH